MALAAEKAAAVGRRRRLLRSSGPLLEPRMAATKAKLLPLSRRARSKQPWRCAQSRLSSHHPHPTSGIPNPLPSWTLASTPLPHLLLLTLFLRFDGCLSSFTVVPVPPSDRSPLANPLLFGARSSSINQRQIIHSTPTTLIVIGMRGRVDDLSSPPPLSLFLSLPSLPSYPHPSFSPCIHLPA